mmetsp:Transcript_54349/g.140379  ORF Transcript_54349/g.140379 Transcript_54349/m.140379 type:complete len:216 (-) Transcript_54349:22-669(-)
MPCLHQRCRPRKAPSRETMPSSCLQPRQRFAPPSKERSGYASRNAMRCNGSFRTAGIEIPRSGWQRRVPRLVRTSSKAVPCKQSNRNNTYQALPPDDRPTPKLRGGDTIETGTKLASVPRWKVKVRGSCCTLDYHLLKVLSLTGPPRSSLNRTVPASLDRVIVVGVSISSWQCMCTLGATERARVSWRAVHPVRGHGEPWLELGSAVSTGRASTV